PEVSYTPYVMAEGKLYVFVSELSVHTGNLKENPRASVLFIEDESQSQNLHARRRVTFPVSVALIGRDDPQWQLVLEQMENRFGEIIPVLKSLPDFHLFAMTTDSANIVRGFADAHTVACDGFQ
ncbi:MAG: pyridoxamine 5'-phosphate oxidase family protein, partial [Pseudomonadota bacterium]